MSGARVSGARVSGARVSGARVNGVRGVRGASAVALTVLVFGTAGGAISRALPNNRTSARADMTGTADMTARPAAAQLADARAGWRRDLRALDAALARVPDCATAARPTRCATPALAAARAAYKRQEALVELLAPAAATALNGRRQEIDDDDEAPPGSARSAFAALEAALGETPNVRAAAAAAAVGRTAVRTLLAQLDDFRLSPPLAFEAARLEVARVATLGITGFDTPDTQAGVGESAVALRGVAALLRAATAPTGARARALAAVEGAAEYADGHPDFARFDRVTFIADHTEPALQAIEDARRTSGVPPVERPRAWVGPTLFARGAFTPRAYAPEAAPPATPALVALGARLFTDPALSGDGTRACASCHVPARAFADGRRAPVAGRGTGGHTALRNTPSLLTAAYEPALFADARAVTLEDQAAAVLASRAEMASSAERVATRLAAMPSYGAAFRAVRGGAPTPLAVRQALAAYVRSLGRAESRVDRAFRGDRGALTGEERAGASLFLGRAGCGTCHYAPLFSGASPPLFRAVDAEVLGVPAIGARRVDADLGRGAIDGRPEHAHAFKIPSLRNVARTAPYMHNGVFRTLGAVVRFYDDGGGRGRGLDVPNQTLPARRLHLTVRERHALVAFLGALSDSAPTDTAPTDTAPTDTAPTGTAPAARP